VLQVGKELYESLGLIEIELDLRAVFWPLERGHLPVSLNNIYDLIFWRPPIINSLMYYSLVYLKLTSMMLKSCALQPEDKNQLDILLVNKNPRILQILYELKNGFINQVQAQYQIVNLLFALRYPPSENINVVLDSVQKTVQKYSQSQARFKFDEKIRQRLSVFCFLAHISASESLPPRRSSPRVQRRSIWAISGRSGRP